MNAAYFRMLFDYSYWARDRVLTTAAGLSSEEFARPNGFTYGSVRGILAHILAGEAIWLSRWNGVSPDRLMDESDFPTLDSLMAVWREEEAKMRRFLEKLPDEGLEGIEVAYRRTSGEAEVFPLDRLMAHLVNHGTQHRSEAAEALTMLGRSPGDLDLIVYYREKLR